MNRRAYTPVGIVTQTTSDVPQDERVGEGITALAPPSASWLAIALRDDGQLAAGYFGTSRVPPLRRDAGDRSRDLFPLPLPTPDLLEEACAEAGPLLPWAGPCFDFAAATVSALYELERLSSRPLPLALWRPSGVSPPAWPPGSSAWSLAS